MFKLIYLYHLEIQSSFFVTKQKYITSILNLVKNFIAYMKPGVRYVENIWKNFQRIEEFDKKLHEKDKTFFYTDFVVEKVIKYGNN